MFVEIVLIFVVCEVGSQPHEAMINRCSDSSDCTFVDYLKR